MSTLIAIGAVIALILAAVLFAFLKGASAGRGEVKAAVVEKAATTRQAEQKAAAEAPTTVAEVAKTMDKGEF